MILLPVLKEINFIKHQGVYFLVLVFSFVFSFFLFTSENDSFNGLPIKVICELLTTVATAFQTL